MNVTSYTDYNALFSEREARIALHKFLKRGSIVAVILAIVVACLITNSKAHSYQQELREKNKAYIEQMERGDTPTLATERPRLYMKVDGEFKEIIINQ